MARCRTSLASPWALWHRGVTHRLRPNGQGDWTVESRPLELVEAARLASSLPGAGRGTIEILVHTDGAPPEANPRRLVELARSLTRGGLALLPVGAFIAVAWTSAPAGPAGAEAAAGRPPVIRAAPARRLAGQGLSGQAGGRRPPYRLDAALPGTIELSSLSGPNGFMANGIAAFAYAGEAVGDAGDVNGDGFDDIVIGAPYAYANGYSGQSYVVYGGSALPGTLDLSALNGTSGFIMNGVAPYDYAGLAVDGAGDVNGDGFDDVIVGAPYADAIGSNAEQSYVVYGGSAVPGTVELSGLNGANGFIINSVSAFDRLGKSVSGAGDVNNDGFDDVIMGAIIAGNTAGQGYVVYGGSAVPGTVELSALSSASGFAINGVTMYDYLGYSVGGAGDVNGDGTADVVIGAPMASPHGTNSGQSYVIYGGSAIPGTINLSALGSPNGFRVNGISAYDRSGRHVAVAGDVNGDGFDDLVISAHYASVHGPLSGQSNVIYGGSATPGTVELSALNGTNGFFVNGVSSYDNAGWGLSGAGDVNGDGFADLVIGADFADPHGTDSGQSYVVYGGSTIGGTVELSALNGTNGVFLNGISFDDRSGSAVSGAGDVNGDGFADVLIGAVFADPHGNRSGQSYVVYGDGVIPPTPTPTPTRTSTPTPTATPTPTPAPTPTPGPGDCNGDQGVTAADLSSIVLEIFDGDGNAAASSGGGTFPGNAVGCDPNGDGVINAGDLSCVVKLIYGGACSP